MELTGQILAVLLIGSTHYVDIGAGKEAVMYYPSPVRAYLRFPDGKVLSGDWRQTDRGYFVKWEGGPEGDWRVRYEPGSFTYFNPNGGPTGKVTRIVPGNPEKF
ncbi:MAG: hypothetical protein ACRC7G_16500 [Beijerinckiaceae bacterium]